MSSAAGVPSDAASQAAATGPKISHQLRSSLLTLNLFEQPHIQSDDLTLRVGRLQTRAFIVLMPLGLLVFLALLIAQGRLITVTVRPSSYEHYQLLAASHADIICPCINDSGSLKDILPPLSLATRPQRPFLGNWSEEGEVMPRDISERDDGDKEGNRYTTVDRTHNWTALGFLVYDNWCVEKRYVEGGKSFAGQLVDRDSLTSNKDSFWKQECGQNTCCLAKAPPDADQMMGDYADDNFVLYTLLGLASRSKSESIGQDYVLRWCRIAVEQRSVAIEHFWQTPMSAATLLSQSLLLRQLQQLWANKALALQSTLRGMLKVQDDKCVGNPLVRLNAKPCEPFEADGSTINVFQDIRSQASMAQRLLQPFLDCNITLPPQGLQTANPLPLDWQTNGVSYNFSSFKHHFPSLIPYAFIESWTPDDARAHREHYGVCSPAQCRYQDLMVTDVVTLLSIMLGVVSGWSGGLKIALGLLGTWWIGRQQSSGKANGSGAHADDDDRAGRSKKDDKESSDSSLPGQVVARGELKDSDQSSFSPSAASSSSSHSPDDVFVHVRVHGTGAEPASSSASGVKHRRVAHADPQSNASAAAVISDSEIDDEEAPLVPRS